MQTFRTTRSRDVRGAREVGPGLAQDAASLHYLEQDRQAGPKFDIIALDEDDVMALTVRWLIDENRDMFGQHRIAFVASRNMPPSNVTSLTTIVNLYDILHIWYTEANFPCAHRPPR